MKGDFDRALADYAEAIRISPQYILAHETRGNAHFERGEFGKAIVDFNEVIRIAPDAASGYISRGTAYLENGDANRAIEDADRAVNKDPTNASAYNLRGAAYREKGDLDHAMSDFDEAIRLNPKFANPRSNRGRVWRAKGNTERALSDFSEALRLNPKLTRAYTHRGQTYENAGDIERARADFKSALEADASGYFDRQAQATARVRMTVLDTTTAARSPAPAKPDPSPAPSIASHSGKRIALVVGNGAYQSATPLPNPVNDARLVAKNLRDIGFEVSEGADLDHAAMLRLIREFLRSAPAAQLALVFYAGHGLQVDGHNYLVPIDAKLATRSDLNFEVVDVDVILDGLNDEARANLIILDACRDNPLARSLANRMRATRSATVSQGLAGYTAIGTGTLIAFATAPGQTALDGDDRNSPFTTALVKHLKTPGLEIRQMLTRVRADVVKATGSKQVPWDNSSLLGEVVLVR
jgi:tetratricopeptide (TPR) repeat protein